MKFQLTPTQMDKYINWRNLQVMKGRKSPDCKLSSRFMFCFGIGASNLEVRVIDNLTKDEIELTEYNTVSFLT